jgi:hypothetical protein
MGLRQTHGYACPQCHQDRHIWIRCDPAWSKLIADDDDCTYWEEGDDGHDWDDSSRAECEQCGWSGIIADAEIASDKGLVAEGANS